MLWWKICHSMFFRQQRLPNAEQMYCGFRFEV